MPSTTRRAVLGSVVGLLGTVTGCAGIGDDTSFPIQRSWYSDFRDASSVAVTESGDLVGGSHSPFADEPLVAGLNEETGEVTWTVTVPKGEKSPIAVRGDRAYGVSTAGSVVAVDTTAGEIVWDRDLDRIDRPDPGVVEFPPIPTGDCLVVPISGTEDDVADRLVGFASAGGERLFTHRLSASLSGAPGATGQGVIAPTLDGRVIALDNTGTVAWERRIGAPLSAVASTESVAYVGAATEELLAVETDAGEIAWRGRLANTVFARPLVTDGRVYVGGADYTVRAFDRASGRQLWRDDLSNAVTHGPVRVGDKLVTLVGGGHRVRGQSGTIPFTPTVLYVHELDGSRVRAVRFDGTRYEGGNVEWMQTAGEAVYLGQSYGLTRLSREAIVDA